jgi:hypothetical protein
MAAAEMKGLNPVVLVARMPELAVAVASLASGTALPEMVLVLVVAGRPCCLCCRRVQRPVAGGCSTAGAGLHCCAPR